MPMDDETRMRVDRTCARAAARGLPFASIIDDTRRACVVWVVVPAVIAEVSVVENPTDAAQGAAGVTGG